MRIKFIRLTPEALATKSLTEKTPVAVYEVEDGGEARVLAGQVTLFQDVQFSCWSGRAREVLLLGLCAQARQAGWVDSEARLLDLARRFQVEPDRDEPNWLLKGFNWIQNVDLHVIKHVLGVGVGKTADVARWSELLGLQIEREKLLGQLENLGCVEWKQLADDEEPEVERPIGIYSGLSRNVRAQCILLLAPLRERYMELAATVVRATASLKNARHIHLGTERSAVMHFLDDRGLTVIAKGECSELVVCTAFSALAQGESSLGATTLRKRWARIVLDVNAMSGLMKVHSPLSWRMGGRT